MIVIDPPSFVWVSMDRWVWAQYASTNLRIVGSKLFVGRVERSDTRRSAVEPQHRFL